MIELLSLIRKLVRHTSNPKGAKITLFVWIGAVPMFSFFAPSAKDYETNSTEGSIRDNRPAEIASEVLNEQYPTDDGLPALIVFHQNDQLTEQNIEVINSFSEWLASEAKPEQIASALPFHQFPKSIQDQMFSEDKTTLLFNIALQEDLESGEMHDTLVQLEEKWEEMSSTDIQFEITGPAGIAADTVSLFKNADFVLMFATIGLIFIILIVIYRSPLLAITPLIIAALVYGIVDRVLGLIGKFEIFPIEGQAVSIMLVLMFAVLTDYSLFVFSRYREELKKHESKYSAMNEAIYHVSEPIFLS